MPVPNLLSSLASMPGGADEVLLNGSGGEAVHSESPARKFTWEELSKLNQRHNAHVAVRGKVSGCNSVSPLHQITIRSVGVRCE